MTDVESAEADFRAALDDLAAAAKENIDRWQSVRDRSTELITAMKHRRHLPAVVEAEQRPRIVEMLTENIATLERVGSRVRRSEAEALRAHGLSLSAIGDLFGVNRQRIAELLQASPT